MVSVPILVFIPMLYLALWLNSMSGCHCHHQGMSHPDVPVRGVGATLPSNSYERWASGYYYHRLDYQLIESSYKECGSGCGKVEMLYTNTTQYGTTDAVLTSDERMTNNNVMSAPLLAGAVVLVYNLPTVRELVLTRQQIVAIYNGSISHWNNTQLQALNPNATFPNASIRVVARSDYSGTTEIFTTALSSFSDEWNNTKGIFAHGQNHDGESLHWNSSVIQLWGHTTLGVAGLVASYRYSIGYVAYSEALLTNSPYVRVVNKMNNTVAVDIEKITAVLIERQILLDEYISCSLTDSSLPEAYPILGFSYILIRQNETSRNCISAMETNRFVEWILSAGNSLHIYKTTGVSPMTPYITKRIISEVLQLMTCNGKNISILVQQQKATENDLSIMWKLPLGTVVSLFLFPVLFLLGSIMYQKYRLRRALVSSEWKIDSKLITLCWDTDAVAKVSSAAGNSIHGGKISRQSRYNLMLSVNETDRKSSFAEYSLSNISKLGTKGVSKLGLWNGRLVLLRKTEKEQGVVINKRKTKLLLLQMCKKILHQNIVRLYGITYYYSDSYLVSEHTNKGTLHDVLGNSTYNLDTNFKFAMALDVCSAMEFLHSHSIIHGNLSSTCCMLDSKWNLKISDWEYTTFGQHQDKQSSWFWLDYSLVALKSHAVVKPESNIKIQVIPPSENEEIEERKAKENFWKAPELLVNGDLKLCNKKTDVYSFGVILVEIFTRDEPYIEHTDTIGAGKVIEKVVKENLRPNIQEVQHSSVKTIAIQTWDENPEMRPSFINILRLLNQNRPSRKSLLDSMMDTLEKYVNDMEDRVEERTQALKAANKNLENLLHQMLPTTVASRIDAYPPFT